VELREDLLNEVTRLYFERRRVQISLGLNDAVDVQGKIEAEMRISELTALIDASTGGEFSRLIGKSKGSNSNKDINKSLTVTDAVKKEEMR